MEEASVWSHMMKNVGVSFICGICMENVSLVENSLEYIWTVGVSWC